jgi:phospholipid/cholesterol/gamma-HCH transport system substrate-binding protein
MLIPGMPVRAILSVKMRLRFNAVERMAGAFILLAMVGMFASGSAVLVRKGFFDQTLEFKTVIPSSESIYTGMPVLMSGVRVGKVTEIDLDESGSAEVHFSVRAKYAPRVKSDSRVSITRQSLIGEKIFDLSAGSKSAGKAAVGQLIEMRNAGDVIGAVTGARVGSLLDNVDRLLVELAELARQLSHKRNTEALMGNLKQTSDSLVVMAESFPQMGRDITLLVSQLAVLGEQLAQKSPTGDTRVGEILRETSVLIQALQRNFLVKGNVSKVREEEQKRLAVQAEKQEAERAPASAPSKF